MIKENIYAWIVIYVMVGILEVSSYLFILKVEFLAIKITYKRKYNIYDVIVISSLYDPISTIYKLKNMWN
jgi:hypothetical protein